MSSLLIASPLIVVAFNLSGCFKRKERHEHSDERHEEVKKAVETTPPKVEGLQNEKSGAKSASLQKFLTLAPTQSADQDEIESSQRSAPASLRGENRQQVKEKVVVKSSLQEVASTPSKKTTVPQSRSVDGAKVQKTTSRTQSVQNMATSRNERPRSGVAARTQFSTSAKSNKSIQTARSVNSKSSSVQKKSFMQRIGLSKGSSRKSASTQSAPKSKQKTISRSTQSGKSSKKSKSAKAGSQVSGKSKSKKSKSTMSAPKSKSGKIKQKKVSKKSKRSKLLCCIAPNQSKEVPLKSTSVSQQRPIAAAAQ
ncbi:unnamed protein product [Cylicocyclus nassatus]|uniref:Uncharacterized protein n=1 Tax=Cylicocyclus nassatus TaxID=53992 RepID=A0AA36DPM3_CYLNA|nr:unnamed protein product [Cylicocyclus nassatus]